jgi:hypothetical protein
MADDRIQIARGLLELGALSRAEADELLRAGFLLPTDTYRCDASQPWQPLGHLLQIVPATVGPLSRVKEAATSVGSGVSRIAAKLVSATSRGSTVVGSAASRLLEDYLPRIRESVNVTLASSTGAIDAKLQDETFQRKLFGAAYDTLPRPVQRFVNEESFVEFCFKHRSKLLGKKD